MALELFSLIVDDYDVALAFFTGTLGFELVDDVPSRTTDGRAKRWVVVRPADGGPGLVLARADGSEQCAAVGRQFAGRVGLFLRVDDFDAVLRRLRQADCDLIRPPRLEPYGRVAVFRDPWGNLWDLLGDVDRPEVRRSLPARGSGPRPARAGIAEPGRVPASRPDHR